MAGDKNVSFVLTVKDAASAALKQVEQAADKVKEKLFSFKEILGELAAAVGVFSVAEIVKDIVELGTAADKTFRQISANLPTFTEGISELKEGIEALAAASGRNIEAMEQSAAAIAKLGASSAEDLQQQLTAATMLADATGATVDESAQLLTQLRREFHLTGEEALDTAAKIASISQGRIGITELQSAFTASAPTFVKFGIDVDTGVRAIASLLSAGLTTSRAIRGELGKLDAEGIRELAKQTPIASDALAELTKRSDEVRASFDATNQRLKNEGIQALEDWGDAFMKQVQKAETAWLGMAKVLKDGNWGAIAAAIAGNPIPLATAMAGSQPNVISSTFTSIKTEGPTPPKITLPQTEAEKKAAEEAAKKIRELRLEFDQLAASTESARPKSDLFAESIAKFAEKARDAKVPAQDIANQVLALNAVLDKMRSDEQGKAVSDAFKELDSAMTELSGGAIAQLDQQVQTLFAHLQEVRNGKDGKSGLVGAGDAEALKRFDDATVLLTTHFDQLRAAVQTTVVTEANLKAIQDDVAANPLDKDKIAGYIADLSADYDVLADKAKKATDPDVAAKYEDELSKVRAVLKSLGADLDQLDKPRDTSKHVLELANAWSTVGRSVIAAAQAVGQMDSATAAALQNMVTLGDGIIKLFSGDVASGLSESLASLGALGKTLFGGDSAEEKAHQKIVEDNSAALRHLADTIKGTTATPGQYAAAGQAISSLIARGSTAGSQYAFGGIGVKANLGALTPGQIDELNAAAKALGISLDGTEASFLQLQAAIDKAEPAIEQMYQEQQKLAQEDLHVRLLRAQGLDAEADAEEFAEKQAREYKAAVDAHADADTLAALAATQAAEKTKFEADQAAAAAEKQKAADEAAAQAATEAAAAVQAFADAMAAAAMRMADGVQSLDDAVDVNNLSPTDAIALAAKKFHIDNIPGDLSTQEGRDAALKWLTGGFNSALDSDTAHNFRTLIDMIRGLSPIGGGGGATGTIGAGAFGNPALASITSGFAGLTSVQGDRMSDQLLRIGNDIHAIRMEGIYVKMSPIAPVNVGAAATAWAAGNTRGGGVSVGPINVHVTTDKEDAAAEGRIIGAEVVREINKALGRQLLSQQTYDGSISVTPS